MAFSAKILSITSPATTGSVPYTGAGFAPKAIFAIGNGLTADGSAAVGMSFLSLGASATQFSSSLWVGNAASPGRVNVAQSKSLFIELISGAGGGTMTSASLTSLDADGFTLNWGSVPDATARVIQVLCLGGTDLSNAFVNELAHKTTTGNQAYTGVGFQPATLIFGAQLAATTDPFALGVGNATQIFGAATSTTNRFYTAGRHKDNANPTVQRAQQKSTQCIGLTGDAAVLAEADFVSFDSDGFTLNFSTVSGTAWLTGYLALKGLQAKIISFTSPGSTGNVGYTGAGFTPGAVIFSSDCGVSSTANTAHCRRMLGMATSSTNRGVISWAGKDAVATSNTSQNLDRTACVKHIVENGATPTFPSVADFVSFDADGFTLNWSVADATARETFALCLGPAAAAGGVTYPQLERGRRGIERGVLIGA